MESEARKEYLRQYRLRNKEKVEEWGRVWQAKNREAITKRQREYNKAHPEMMKKAQDKWRANNKERTSSSHKSYRANHHEYLKKQQRDRAKLQYARDRDKILERNRQWRQRNPNNVRERASRRRALKAEATVNQSMIVEWMSSVRSKKTCSCYYCLKRISTSTIHFDHIIPLSSGGPHRVENLCVSCARCNLTKGSKPVRVWIKTGQQLLEV